MYNLGQSDESYDGYGIHSLGAAGDIVRNIDIYNNNKLVGFLYPIGFPYMWNNYSNSLVSLLAKETEVITPSLFLLKLTIFKKLLSKFSRES